MPQLALAASSVLTSNCQHYVSSRRSQDNLFICLNLYIRTNPSDPYVLRHLIYLLQYLTVIQSWVGVVAQYIAAPLCSEQFIWDLRTDYDSLRTFKNNLKTFLYRRVITYPVSCGASDYSVLLEFGAILLLLSPCHLYRIS